MAVHLSIEELMRYSLEERDKWRHWLSLNPTAIDALVQPGGELPTVGKLIDHIFLAERRTLQRLSGQPAVTATGLSGSNVPPLFDYGASVRRELEAFVRTLDDNEADAPREVMLRNQVWTVTPRKLLVHILLHETRHWAQIALAVRLAGFTPPGNHDFLFSAAMK
jgi:uncharacterized damage-inducible protein DinB